MKKIIILTIIVTFGFLSCEDYIEETRTGSVTGTQVYATPEGINFGLNATYTAYTRLMGNANNREDGWSLITLGTDIFTNGSDGGQKRYNRYDDIESGHNTIANAWTDLYIGINTANAVIERAPGVIQDTEELNNILGQARFLRGIYYFWLVRQYGNIHYSAQETKEVETTVNLIPKEEIYNNIVEDMQFAADNLPGVQEERGRITSWAAKMGLAEVNLTIKNYDEAAQFAEDVINNGPFSLVRPFEDLWKLENHDDNSEVIYSVQFAGDPLFDASGNPAHLFFLMEYDRRRGMRRDLQNGRPFKRFKPTEYLLELFDMEDERYDATFRSVWFANNESSLPDGLAIGDTAVYLPRVAFSQAEKDARPFGRDIYNRDELTDRIYPSIRKWEQPNRIDVNSDSGDRDFIVYRLADAYLIAAEANALKSSPDQNKALQYLNEVRMRAYNVDNVADLPVITSVDIDVILEERAKEFVAEGKRWFDLVRTGKLVERVRLYNSEGAPNIQDFHVLRPIPQSQIDRTENDYPQNTGY